MENFIIEAALLMLAAYLLGAILGCLSRRMLAPGKKQQAGTSTTIKAAPSPAAASEPAAVRDAPEPVQPKIETLANPAPPQDAKISDSARFERVLTSAPATAPSNPQSTSEDADDHTSTSTAAATAAAAAAATAAVATASSLASSETKETTTAKDAGTDARLPSASGTTGTANVAAPITAAVAATAATAAAPSTPAAPDDLSHIDGIGPTAQKILSQNGITNYSQIAAWTTSDVQRIDGLLGGTSRVSRQNWIEQAKILAAGGTTEYVKRMGTSPNIVPAPKHGLLPAEPLPVTQPDTPAAPAAAATPPSAPKPAPAANQSATSAVATGAAAAAAAAAATVAASTTPKATATPTAPPAGPDDLKKIEGIDEAAEQILNSKGVNKYAQIAGWQAVHVQKVDSLLGTPGRVSKQNWIEQAKVLASGGQTAFSRGDRRAAQPVTRTPVTAAAQPTHTGDDLKRIKGVDKAAEQLLLSKGVSTFAQIAKWTPAHEQKVDQLLNQPNRVENEKWIGQARLLADGKDPAGAFSASTSGQPPASGGSDTSKPGNTLATAAAGVAAAGAVAAAAVTTSTPAQATPAPTPPTASEPAQDKSTSTTRPARLADAIRQNADHGSSTPAPSSSVAGMRSVRSQLLSGEASADKGTVDDLKKIRGVGVLIEKKLNAMGIHNYEQIAQWSAGDIDRISRVLDFKGRIEREGWVQQARILSSGGQTEFSKRLT